MTPAAFIAKWQRASLSERSAAHSHFIELCEVLGQPTPTAEDPDGSFYTFEKGVKKTGGESGFADVWFRAHFAWEYKGKHKDLAAAYKQLLQYREDLENPPLLVVCDLDRFEVHTNFTGTAKRVYAFDLAGLAEPANLDILRKLFTAPDALRPGQTTKAITEQAAELFGQLADGMRVRGVPAQQAAHFLMKLMFCLFAEDVELLPEKLFSKILTRARRDVPTFAPMLADLFEKMAHGGQFGADDIPHFNGGLFADVEVIELTADEIEKVSIVSGYDWSQVEPSIFGTLFERTLDPEKRSQIGAHYTSEEDIRTLLVPVMFVPLRREWERVKGECEALWPKVQQASRVSKRLSTSRYGKAISKLLDGFFHHLEQVRVLDPACGSGNFLYVALRLLLDLEKEAIVWASQHGILSLPHVRPTQLSGIEINPYAQQLAQIVIWIGYLQWMRDNGFAAQRDPVLEPIESIRLMDAIIDLSDPAHPLEPEWPEADFIVGNPPFLGNKRMRSQLGAGYVTHLWALYGERLPATSDLCCYWFEKARDAIERKRCKRAGLLATTGIRQVGARQVLERIHETLPLYFAISDRDWVLDGASVRISMVGFGESGKGEEPSLDGHVVAAINADLTSGIDLTQKRLLPENEKRCFMGTTKVGAFDISHELAARMLVASNPHGLPNSDVLRPFRNGSDLVRTCSHRWIVDFGVAVPINIAAPYEAPFEFVVETVKPEREKNRRQSRAEKWWLLGETLPAFRVAVRNLRRYLGTPRVSKHRVFVWLDSVVLPDSKVLAISVDDDFSFGVLQSRLHECWTLACCGWHGLGNDATYNPTTCFETFPFPEPTDAQREAIAAAAKELDALRNKWLNPPEWTREEILEFPGSAAGPWARYVHDADSRGIGTVRYSRTVPRDEECAKELAKQTLTNLYNKRPTWLDLAHRRLDEAVFAAYGWGAGMGDEELLGSLLGLNLERAGRQ